MPSPTFAEFNPTGDSNVAAIKETTDDLIALVRLIADAPGSSGDAKRRAAIAITNYEQAAMWAVKALFS